MSLIGTALSAKFLATTATAAAALAVAAAGVTGYFKGKSADRQRSDLVISGMKLEASEKLATANQLIKAQSQQLQANKEKADNDLLKERQLNTRRTADRAAADRVVREQLLAFAGGPGPAADTLTACRGDASTLGHVLDRALLAHGVCSGAAEAEASGARALLAAWPKSPLAPPAPTH